MQTQSHTKQAAKRSKRVPSGTKPVAGFFETGITCLSRTIREHLSQVLDSSNLRDAYLLSNLTTKLGSAEVTEEQRAKAAIDGWYADEAFNRKTTRRLMKLWRYETDHTIHGVDVRLLLGEASALIAETLGPWSHEFYKDSSFTNGAAVGYGKAQGDPVFKYAGVLTTTPLAVIRLTGLLAATPAWYDYHAEKSGFERTFRVVPGEHGFTVSKNAETDRYCSKQPTGNMLLQKALGYRIRCRLKLVGIDLDDQSKNREAARRASITRRDATIDLKSASNSVVCALLLWLLPADWLREIMATRSPLCKPTPDSPWVKTEMVGAMGNGFTFELESLVFWALAETVRRISRSRGKVLVFGDDLIAPVHSIHMTMALYQFCGFRINRDKSFWTGSFRESCGGHYDNGLDITPIYIRKPITDTTRVIWFLNKLRAWAEIDGVCDDRVWPLYRKLQRKYVSPELWGGVRSSSITSLWTPHERRSRLTFKVKRTRLYGVPALLRTFQYSRDSSYRLIRNRIDSLKLCGDMDVQAYYEVFGAVPISESMEYLTSISVAPAFVAKNPEWSERPCPTFEAENRMIRNALAVIAQRAAPLP